MSHELLLLLLGPVWMVVGMTLQWRITKGLPPVGWKSKSKVMKEENSHDGPERDASSIHRIR